MQLAQQKAADIAGKTEGDAWILGADTIVVYDQKILGKPKDEEDASGCLACFRIIVIRYTPVYASGKKKMAAKKFVAFTKKRMWIFYPMTEEEITKYVATGEPMDKAGSYGNSGHRWSVRP